MIEIITWDMIENVWKLHLWPTRKSKIETNSAMCYQAGYDMFNMTTKPTFFGYYVDNKLVGVNSGHSCNNNMYRSRGLWVFPEYRKKGIGKQLLLATIEQAKNENTDSIWSYPKRTSWKTYESAGFRVTSEWAPSETSEENAYCIMELK